MSFTPVSTPASTTLISPSGILLGSDSAPLPVEALTTEELLAQNLAVSLQIRNALVLLLNLVDHGSTYRVEDLNGD